MGISRVAIVGAGRIGVPIASVLARAGYDVCLVDLKPRPPAETELLWQRIQQEVRSDHELLAEEGAARPEDLPEVLARLRFDQGMGEWIRKSDMIIEALPETKPAKEPFYAAARRETPSDTLFCSTTSTFSPDELATWAPEPRHFMGVHFINPVLVMPLVEVGVGMRTDPEAVSVVKLMLERAGKVPVVCRPRAGFIMPRLQVLVMNEAMRIVEEGVASPEDVDKAFSNHFGFRYLLCGLLEFVDWGGVDVLYHAGNYLAEKLGDAKFRPPDSVRRLVEQGAVGLKSGRGVYEWPAADRESWERERKRRYIRLLRWLGRL